MSHIELIDAKDHLLELVDQVVHGEEVVIMKGKRPLVKLVSVVAPPRQRHFGSAKGLITIADDFDTKLVADFVEYQ